MIKSFLLLFTLLIPLTFSIPSYASSEKIYVDVHGLVCDFCARALEKLFGKQEAVSHINVNLDDKIITISFKEGKTLSDKRIAELVEDAGYNVVQIRHTNTKKGVNNDTE